MMSDILLRVEWIHDHGTTYICMNFSIEPSKRPSSLSSMKPTVLLCEVVLMADGLWPTRALPSPLTWKGQCPRGYNKIFPIYYVGRSSCLMKNLYGQKQNSLSSDKHTSFYCTENNAHNSIK